MNRKNYFRLLFLLFMLVQEVQAQTEIKGFVKDKNSNKALAGVEVALKNSLIKSYTNEKGEFLFHLTKKVPSIVIASFKGYSPVEISVNVSGENIIYIEPLAGGTLSNKKLSRNIINNASLSYYDALANMPGVGISTQSFLYQSITNRGINSISNIRFSQYVDGMDNQLPGLNFPVGNMLGAADIDVEKAELLSEKLPALRGGVNGTLVVNSKNPFTNPGLSAQFRLGMNHLDNYQAGRSSWEDMSLRYARVLNNRLGVKVAISYIQGKDWRAQNLDNFDRLTMQPTNGDRYSNAAYDGVNVYGDENAFRTRTLRQIGSDIKDENPNVPCHCLPEPKRSIVTAFNNGMLPKIAVTRTGYAEEELVDYGTSSLKTSGAIHYRISSSIEAIAQINWRRGNTMYTDVDRYALKDFNLSQYKLELKGKQFLLRGYTTQVNAGDAYNVTRLGGLINEAWKPTSVWLNEYIAAFSSEKLKGLDDQSAHNIARAVADQGRPGPGSSRYGALKNNLIANGAILKDNSNLFHYEGMYDFTSLVNNKLDLLVGGSFRKYNLNSEGTIFNDLTRKIELNEYAAYMQLGKNITNKIKLTGSLRVDKNQNFDVLYSPGFIASYAVNPNSAIRVSYYYQQRNPVIQNQYIDYQASNGGIHLLGGLPEILNKYQLNTNRPFTAESYRDYVLNGAVLQEYIFDEKGVQPEQVEAVELGYRGNLGSKVFMEAYSYYNRYHNYISSVDVYQTQVIGNLSPHNMIRYYVPVNVDDKLYSWGTGLSMGYQWRRLIINGNITYTNNNNLPSSFNEGFNMPQVLFNFGVSGNNIAKNVGFNVVYRWQEDFYWQSGFVNGQVPAFGTLDGQISFKVPSYNSIIKIGGSNLLNQYYKTSYGNPLIGGMYYISIFFNEFLK